MNNQYFYLKKLFLIVEIISVFIIININEFYLNNVIFLQL